MERKGQAALEFLTTYGWAILIIMVMIGTISYFGIMNPKKLLPDRCISSSEMSCTDYIIEGSNERILLRLEQGLGKTIYFQAASCEYNGRDIPITAANLIGGGPLNPGDAWSPRATVQLECDLAGTGISGLLGEKIRVPYNITYSLSPGGFNHETSGELISEVQG